MKIYSIGFSSNRYKLDNRNIGIKTSPIETCDSFLRTGKSTGFNGGLTSLAVHCPGCEIKTVTPNRFNVKLQEKVLSGKSQQAINVLQEFEKNMHSTEKEVFLDLKEKSKKYPNENLQELLIRLLPEHLKNLKKRQLEVIEKAKPLTKNLNKELARKVSNIIGIAEINIKTSQDGILFKNETPLTRIKDLIKENPKNKRLQKIYQTISYLPAQKDDIYMFLTEYSKKSSFEIGQRLVKPSIATLDHYEPLAKGGEDTLDNNSNMCNHCNKEKEDTKPNKWMAQNPKRFNYIKLYMQDVTKELLNHHSLLENEIYETYPQDFIDNVLKQLTKNELEKPTPSKARLKQYKILHDDLQVIVDDFYTKLDKKREQKYSIAS